MLAPSPLMNRTGQYKYKKKFRVGGEITIHGRRAQGDISTHYLRIVIKPAGMNFLPFENRIPMAIISAKATTF